MGRHLTEAAVRSYKLLLFSKVIFIFPDTMNALRTLRNHAMANMQVYASLALGTGVGLSLLPQTAFLYKYQEMLANYTKTGDQEEVSEGLQRTVAQVNSHEHFLFNCPQVNAMYKTSLMISQHWVR